MLSAVTENDAHVTSPFSPRRTDHDNMPESPEQVCVVTPTAAETSLPWKRPSATPPMSSARSHSTGVLESSYYVSELPAWIGTGVGTGAVATAAAATTAAAGADSAGTNNNHTADDNAASPRDDNDDSDEVNTNCSNNAPMMDDDDVASLNGLDAMLLENDINNAEQVRCGGAGGAVVTNGGGGGLRRQQTSCSSAVDIIVTSPSPVACGDGKHKHVTTVPSHEFVDPNNVDAADAVNAAAAVNRHNLQNNVCAHAKQQLVTAVVHAHPVVAMDDVATHNAGDAAAAAIAFNAADDDTSPIPPPWRNNNDSPSRRTQQRGGLRHDMTSQLSHNDSSVSFTPIVCDSPPVTPADEQAEDKDVTLPLPWRCERAPEVRHQKTLPVNSSLPPSWRQLSTESGALR